MNLKKAWHEIIDFIKLIAKDNKKVVPAFLFGGSAKAVLPFVALFFSAKIINQLLAGNYEGCVRSVALLLLFQFVLGIIDRICYQVMELLRESSDHHVKRRLAGKIYTIEYEKFEKQETLDTIKGADVAAMGTGGAGEQVIGVYRLAEQVCSILFSLFFLVKLFLKVETDGAHFLTSYWATIVLMAVYTVLLMLDGKIAGRVVEIRNEMVVKNNHNNSVINYLVEKMINEKNAQDFRVFQLKHFFGEKFEELMKGLSIYLEAGKRVGVCMGISSGFFHQLGAAAAFIFVGAKAVYGVIGVGDVLLYAGAVTRVMDSITGFVKETSDFMYMASYLKTYQDFINSSSMSYDGTLPVEKRDDGRYEFEFHDVSFSYPAAEGKESRKVLRNINLKFDIGKKVALVGRNGAGKTTLIKLLCRLYEPTEGYITLNDIDICKYSYEEYTRIFSVVFQDFHLFSMPLDENVASGAEVDEDRLWKVLEQVSLKERVKEMKDGAKTRLYHNNGEGVDVSGGEAQRIAIARALYKDAPFVILDEPTAALDPIAEAEIYENFNRMVEKKTAVYISHRMSSCKFCDNIVVLEGGEMKENGNHEELLERGGIYAELYETQAQYYA